MMMITDVAKQFPIFLSLPQEGKKRAQQCDNTQRVKTQASKKRNIVNLMEIWK